MGTFYSGYSAKALISLKTGYSGDALQALKAKSLWTKVTLIALVAEALGALISLDADGSLKALQSEALWTNRPLESEAL